MDPVTVAALVGLGGKLVDVGARVFDSWMQNRSGGVAIAADGARFDLAQGGGLLSPELVVPSLFELGEPVPFQGGFIPADPWSEAWLTAEQPVMLVIEDQNQQSPLDSMVALVSLGDGFEGSLFPGWYQLGAFVFLNDDPESWGYVDGGGLASFSVEPGEPPFSLQIPIEAVPEPTDIFPAEPIMEDSGYLNAGEEAHYDTVLEEGIVYSIYVAPANPNADLDLFVLDENRNVVAQDVDVEADALCTVAPAWTGAFTVVVLCDSGSTGYQITMAV
ncbi:MAG: hypothetical protein QNJ81_12285 [Acidimicrobiia bacterium]|nr:hypothetical protein [Acidimicrobiia bacterium]